MSDGSELHRLKPMQDYNAELFNKLYKNMRPLIRKLARNVDAKRFNVTPDIIQSYFCDKFLFVFNKYQAEYDEERLKATILSSLSTFKNRLLRNAYTEQAEYNQSLAKLDDLFDDSKELMDNSEEERLKEERLEMLYAYMKKNLSPDAYLVFEAQLNPPPFIAEQLRTTNSKVSTVLLLDFFEMPRTKTNSNWISDIRKDIEYYTEKAKEDLNK
ncbi:MAG: hypothetical protein RSC49_01030 [Clostridium sp.]